MRALVTGAGARLGAAMARDLGAQGWDVALHYSSSADGAQAVADDIRGQGRQAVLLQADLLDLDACEALVPRAAEALGGPLTLLVNNASIFEHDDIRTASRRSWDRHVGSNLRAPLILTQAFAAQTTAGNIVNMIDQRVRKLTPEFMTYTLAKTALWTLTQTSAQALGPGIRVNAIGPGPTLQGVRQSAAHFAAQQAATLTGQGAGPEDITGALRYILAAPALTGQLLCIDGGQHLIWQTPDVQGVE
ncbi:SDR family oxidoreductase [Jannaschia sp. M317]|uniref:SDR family oxidoreductase n=1 Tax=Jannaschia sp. M317 TaxID=2867011 RepID=UPI0021A33E8D|nr:SDR family oxidoreductase [Jannaschia sp. M317]UWQ19008.1 SDR family oxidoreductase [Jannaschia sp. M317]